MVKTVAIITARSGSKRIPHKNIKEFCGKPIIAYSIQTALESQLFNTVMVSTDDEMIADVARQYGAEVPFMRSEETSNIISEMEVQDIDTLTDWKLAELKYKLFVQDMK